MRVRDDRLRALLGACALLSGAAGTAWAKPQEATYGHRTAAEARSALNREQADAARRQLAANAANQQAFADAQAARAAQIRHDQEAWEAEKTRLAGEHDAAMARWRADAAACRAGDWSKCKHHR